MAGVGGSRGDTGKTCQPELFQNSGNQSELQQSKEYLFKKDL